MAALNGRDKISVHMPTSSGTEGEFQIFSIQYKAYAKVHKFAQASKIDHDMPSDDAFVVD
jgi:hypothetical protein